MEQYCRNCGALLNDRYPVCIMCRKGKGVGDKFCAFCGEELPEPGAAVCPACGMRQTPADPKKPITPEKARFGPVSVALISLVMPGMGQAMNFQLVKGVLIFFAYVLFTAFTSGPKIGLFLQGIWHVVAAVDAYRIADRLKNGESVGKWQSF